MVGQTPREIQERVSATRTLTAAGESAEQIATRLGVSPRTVVRYRSGHTVGRERDRTALLARIATLSNAGLSTRQISQQLGVNHKTVAEDVRQMRLEGKIGCCDWVTCPNRRWGECEFAGWAGAAQETNQSRGGSSRQDAKLAS